MGKLKLHSRLRCRFRAVRLRLSGSSMIEAIVASLIFLGVFVVSLSTLTGLTLRDDEGYTLLEVERRLTECSLLYGDGTWAEGTYTDSFNWGEITTVVSRYADYDNIVQIALCACPVGSRKIMEHRQLIVNER